MTKKIPALFVGHGNPMNALDEQNPFNQKFAEITQSFDKPKAILCISAHWYSEGLFIMGNPNPPMIYDFYGFPKALSEVQYPAKGSPELVAQVQELLADTDLKVDLERGFDHGAWAVLKFLYPKADIPVVQLSLDATKPAQWHADLAKKLAPLRKQGVLILASGDIIHNLRLMNFRYINDLDAGYDWAFAFRDQINQTISDNNLEALVHFEQFGENAKLSVPTPDHYLPLLYVMALREEDDEVLIFNDSIVGGSISMTSVLVGGRS